MYEYPDAWADPKPTGVSDEKKKIVVAYQQTFSSASGQAVLDDMKRAYGDRCSFTPGDPHRTAFREGQRDVYLRIVALLNQKPTIQNSIEARETSA